MKRIAILTVLLISAGFLNAQGFGFDNDDGDSVSGGSAVTVTISGEVSAELLGYFDDFHEGADRTNLGDVFSGELNFKAGTPFADGVINLNLQATPQPVSIDEAYVRAFFGGFEIEGGLRKLTWGKADSLGPLDVINPLDYSELTNLDNIMSLKIARPLVHASYRFGSFNKIEALFVPTFEPLRYAEEDSRWVPAQMKQFKPLLELDEDNLSSEFASMLPDGFQDDFFASMLPDDFKVNINRPNKLSTVKYAQAGARFTTTIGPADFGLQYYYGRLTRPAYSVILTHIDTSVPVINMPITIPIPTAINLDYNPYHQIGVDWAQVLFGFNVRAEFAANITYDFKGDDPYVYNPSLLWSLGFDRDLIAGINLNFQCNESIRLMNDKIKDDRLSLLIPQLGIDALSLLNIEPPLLDIEAGTAITSTRITAAIFKKFFRDQLETRVAVMWGIEDKDFLLIPSIIWTHDTVSLKLSAGIFGGKEEGQLGQYKDNSFIKTVLSYSF